MIFLFASIAMYKTPVRTVAAVKISGRSGWRCASDAVLCRNCRIDQLSRRFNRCFHRTGDCRIFVHISNVQTFPLFTCLSAVIVKLFVPSGGAQWAVQGPIVRRQSRALCRLCRKERQQWHFPGAIPAVICFSRSG